MKLQDFVEEYLVDEIDYLVQESYWTCQRMDTDRALKITESKAKEKGIIIDEESLDEYDDYFNRFYAFTEKGLS